jgi:FkbM family methyltransferase
MTRKLVKRYTEDFSIKLVSYYQSLADNGWYEHSELETQEWVMANVGEDWVIFDCGAHIGYYSMLFSHCAPKGKVYAFEPCDLTCQYFANNVRVNKNERDPYHNITLVKSALGDEVAKNVPETLWFSGQGDDGFGKTEGVFDFTTIDAFCAERSIDKLDLIKSDVDGWDYELLLGARKTIERFQPILLVEVNYALGWRGHNAEEVKEFIEEIDYTWTVLDSGSPSNWLMRPKYYEGSQ